jgi:transglutaminase-like putative cysteine protease
LEEAPPNRVVLRIHTGAPLPPSPQPHYWRARLLNLYDGRSWFSNAQVEPFNPALPVSAEVPGTIRQEISDNRPGGAILVALPDVISVDVPANAERLADGELAALTVPASAPAYQVLSRSQELALPPRPDAPPPDLSDSLGLPAGVPERVRELAAAVAGGVDSPAERALALEAYLRELPYSYEVRPLPRDGDAVDQFLFEMRHGYCTYYASAMAVMARTLGIPARVSIGYATGAYDQASGAYVVSAADAHAWPELYIGGRWTPFEPTPVRALPDRGVAVPTPTAVPAPAESPSVRPGAWLVGAGVGLGVLLMFIGGWFLWRRSSRPLALRVQARLEQRGARSGVAWPPGATLREYGALLALRLDGATDALGEVVDLVERAQYSNHALNDTEEQRLRNAATRLWKHMPRRRSGSAGVTR